MSCPNPLEFTSLEVQDRTLANERGRKTGFEVVPLRSGTQRHEEEYTRSDFWVTRYRPNELLAGDLPKYARKESVVEEDIVVWYTGSAHHEDHERDEDRDTVPVIWTGFQIVPHNLFAGTPFFEE